MIEFINNPLESLHKTDNSIKVIRHRFDPKSGSMVDQPKSEPFLKGPIPITWLNRAALLPGKAINVALAIRWLSDMNANSAIKLSRKSMALFNFSSDAASDAIRRLESGGLIKVQRRPGQRPMIEILLVGKDVVSQPR